MKTKAITIMLTLFLIGVLSIPVMVQAENADLNQELAELRKATEKYHDEAEALADGYMPFGPHIPGMGAHYLNLGLILAHNGSFVLEEPEVVQYSLAKGKPKLVVVMYIVIATPGGAPSGFTGTSDVWEFEPSMCHFADGHELMPAPTPGDCLEHGHFDPLIDLWHPPLWALHVWVWRGNPDGIFAMLNPNVP